MGKIVDEETFAREEFQSKYFMSEKKIQQLHSECEDLKKRIEEIERKRHQQNIDFEELSDTFEELRRSNDSLHGLKIKMETELELLHADFEEQSLHLRIADEKFIQSSQEQKKLEDDLQCERQNMVNEETMRKNAELKLRELEIKFENDSLAISCTGRKMVEKLENKIKSLEDNLEQEKRKCRDYHKMSKQMERNYKDMNTNIFKRKETLKN